MDDENVLHGKESLVDYTQLGTIDSAVLDEWQHLAGMVRETIHVIMQHPGSFHIHLPQYLARVAKGFVGAPYWLFVCSVCFLAVVIYYVPIKVRERERARASARRNGTFVTLMWHFRNVKWHFCTPQVTLL